MDEVFSIFLDVFSAPIGRQEVPVSSIEHYRGKLPNRLLEYWAEHGWCGYGNGIFWIVNPQEYDGVVASWLEGTKFEKLDVYHLIARGAFGDLYLWGEKNGSLLTITSIFSRCDLARSNVTAEKIDLALESFILSRNVDSNDFEGMFDQAIEKLGALNHDEMYGFVPAVMLGGPHTIDHLQKVKAVEHLMLLSQLTELEPYSFSDI